MSEATFLLEQASWPVLLVDRSGTIWRANAAAVRWLGPGVGKPLASLAAFWAEENPVSFTRFFTEWEQAPLSHVIWQIRPDKGPVANCSVAVCGAGEPGRFLAQVFSGTGAQPEIAAKNFDTVFARKQKLDCALQLARTVALDFNNALTSILGHTSLVLSKMEPNDPWRNSLLEVEKSAAKAAEIASDLAAFSRQDKEQRVQVAGNLNQLVQRTLELFEQNTGAKRIDWRFVPERELFSAKFDEAKLQQALMKVFENAIEALPGSGWVTAQTRNLEFAEATRDCETRLLPGTYVCIEISDSGHGIPPGVLPRIFEPFFTTKGGHHRGLGLAWVYGIVTNHGGGVSVSSHPNAGTSVRLYLPAEKRIVIDSPAIDEDLKGSATVLIVDDEDLLLTMGETILSDYGYKVVTANNGQRALEIILADTPPVDLLLTDLIMPGMSGRELVERLHDLPFRPRILCTSGYAWPASQIGEANYLQKPFTAQDLLRKVKQALAT